MRRAGAFALALLALALLPAEAARAQERERHHRTHRHHGSKRHHGFTVSPRAYEHLIAAQEALAQGDAATAREQLDALRAKEERLSDHEQALLHQSYGYLEADAERYDAAIGHLERSLAKQALPEAAQLQTLYNLSQLYVATERYEQAVRSLREWIAASEQPAPRAHYLLAFALHQQGEAEAAIASAEQAVALAEEPAEPWLQLLVALLLERERYAEARAPLEALAERFPDKRHWMQLASLYAQLDEEPRSLAVLELARAEGLLDRDAEWRRLARLYLYQGLPYRAARVLEQGLADGALEPDPEAWELLGNAWLRAREFDRAVEPLERAAQAAQDGRIALRLAQAHVQRERWQDAASALERALAKGGLEDPGRAHLLLGIARFHLQRLDAARSAFARAARSERTRADAKRWLAHLESARAAREES